MPRKPARKIVRKTLRRNPSRPPVNRQLQQASQLYEDFSGNAAEVVAEVDKPEMPDVLVAVGDVDGIMYTTNRDGKTERYIHEFKQKSRPLFAVSFDGSQLYLLGGAYDFTDRGIVDRR